MAGAKALRNRLNDEFLTCQICLSTYTEPVLLDCQHSFCRSCVGQCLPAVSGTLHCPVCRQATSLPKKFGVATLKSNFFLQSLIDAVKERRSSVSSVVTIGENEVNGNVNSVSTVRKVHDCDNCEGENGKAVSRCLDCTDYLCRDCQLCHCQTKFTKKHKIVSLKDLRSGKYSLEIQTRAKVFCPNHPDETCREICKTCFVPACHECLQNIHSDHQKKDLKEAVANQKERTEQLLQRSTESRQSLMKNMEETKKQKNSINRASKASINTVQRRAKIIVDAAKMHEEKIVKGIKEMNKKRKASLVRIEEEGNLCNERLQSVSENLKQSADVVLVSGTPADILGLKELSDKVETVLQEYVCLGRESSCIESTWKLSSSCENNDVILLEKLSPFFNELIGILQYGEDIVVSSSHEDQAGASSVATSEQSLSSEPSTSSSNDQPTSINDDTGKVFRPLSIVGSNNTFTSDEDELPPKPLYYKLNPVQRRKRFAGNNTDQPSLESPSLNLMRKFPPIEASDAKTATTSHDKTSKFSTSSVKTSGQCCSYSRSDASSTKHKVNKWRSKSADRVLDNDSGLAKAKVKPTVSTPVNHSQTTGRGRTRRRSLPGCANPSLTLRAIQSPTGSADSLLSLTTSPVKSLAENPALLGLYETPDPTSDAAVACLANSIASAPPLETLNDSNPSQHPDNHDIQAVPPTDRILIRSFTVSGKLTIFRSAPKLSVTPSGQMVATDYKAQKLFVFCKNGSFVNSIKVKSSGSKSLHPISATSTKKNKFLVACGDAVYKFSQSGKMTKKFGNGYFSKCCGIVADQRNGKIIVTDIEKRCVSIHAADGGLERIFRGGASAAELVHSRSVMGAAGISSDHDLRLQTPYFTCVDPRNGNIIVSDWASNDVKIFDQDGGFLACIFSCSKAQQTVPFSPGPVDTFCNPAGVCCDGEGNIFVADHGRHRVVMFDNNWQFEKFVATNLDGIQNPWSVVVGENRQLFLSEYWSRTIKLFAY
ncbi:uncharacterized protein LOC100177710 isoform X1 [Ciona intestinalis]